MKKLLIIITLLVIPFSVFANVPKMDYDGWHLISSLEELRWISEHPDYWSSKIKLDNDIDATDTKNWNGGLGWNPIGNENIKFTGQFNGRGYTISNLYINDPEKDYVGFFGYVSGGDIDSVKMENVNISGNNYVGTIFGLGWSCENSYASGNIKGFNYVGGLAGFISCKINNSSVNVTINANNYVGGLSGFLRSSNEILVSNSMSMGHIVANKNIGGLVGVVHKIYDTRTNNNYCLTNNYSNCNIKCDSSNCGGLVGRLDQMNYTSYNGHPSSQQPNLGKYNYYNGRIGTFGYRDSISPIVGSFYYNLGKEYETTNYYNKDKSPILPYKERHEQFGKSESKMKLKRTYTNNGWDFDTVWDIDPDINDGFPYLRNLNNIKKHNSINDIYEILEPCSIRPNCVFPGETVNVKIGNVMSRYNIDVFDINGEFMYSSYNNIDTHTLIRGSYIIRIVTNDCVYRGRFFVK